MTFLFCIACGVIFIQWRQNRTLKEWLQDALHARSRQIDHEFVRAQKEMDRIKKHFDDTNCPNIKKEIDHENE